MLAILDYDGTATTHECIELVLQRLVGDAWRPFEAEIRAGRMSHADGLVEQVALLQAPREEIFAAMIAEAVPMPGLAAFLEANAADGGRTIILSAGFREVIEAVWRRDGLPRLDIYASELIGDGPPYSMSFSAILGDCPVCGRSQCKGAAVRSLRRPGEQVLDFGDGASDICAAREAGLTFARDHLAKLCAVEDLEWRPLPDFTHVWDEVLAWRASPAGR